MCLFIGKLKSQTIPRDKQMLPIKYIAIILSFKDLDLFNIRCPQNIPEIPVAIEGIVLKNPSGSQVSWYILPGVINLSIQAAKLFPGSKMPTNESPKGTCFRKAQ